MKKNVKRSLSLVLALCMVLSLAVTGFAVEPGSAYDFDDFKAALAEAKALVAGSELTEDVKLEVNAKLVEIDGEEDQRETGGTYNSILAIETILAEYGIEYEYVPEVVEPDPPTPGGNVIITERTAYDVLTIDEDDVYTASEGYLLTMIVDGVETAIEPGTYENVVFNLTEDYSNAAIGSYNGRRGDAYRAALYINNGIVAARSATDAVSEGTYDGTVADGLVINSTSDDFSGLMVMGGEYTLSNSEITMITEADGSTTNDFSGIGAAISVMGSGTSLVMDNVDVYTEGVAKVNLFVDNGANALVKNSRLHADGGTLYEGYVNSANQTKMVAPPWVLGISGNARTTNLMGNYSSYSFVDSDMSAYEWGVLSTDAGENMLLVTINSTIKMTGDTGYGTYIIGNAQEYFYGTHFDVPTYASILTGGSATYASSIGRDSYDIVNMKGETVYTGVTSDREDGNTVIDSRGFGFMAHNIGTLNIIEGTEVNTEYATFLMKSATNTINIDDSSINADSGIILQMIDNDDSVVGMGSGGFNTEFKEVAGYPGKTDDGYNGVIRTSGSTNSTTANLTNVDIVGDFWNSTGYTANARAMNVNIGANATVEGLISAGTAMHWYDGEQQTYFTIDEYYKLGHVLNTQYYHGNNKVAVNLTDGAVWTVTGESVITSLTIDAASSVVAPRGKALAMTVDGAATELVAGKSYSGVIVITLTDPTWVIRETDPDAEQRIIANSAYIVAGVGNVVTDNRVDEEKGTNNYTSGNGRGASAIYVTDMAETEFTDAAITGNGILDSYDLGQEFASKYGYASAALVNNGGKLVLNNPTIVTTGSSYANGGYSSDKGSELYVYGGTITTANTLGHGLDATYQGYIYAEDVVINTSGGNSAAIATDFQGGIIDLYNVTATSNRSGSPGIYAAGQSVITAYDSSFTATVGEGVMLAHSDGYTYLYDSSVTGQIGVNSHNYQTMYGPNPSYLIMEGGSVTSTAGALLTVSGGFADMSFDNVKFNIADGYAFIGAGQGTLTVNAKDISETIVGDVTMNRTTALTLNLANSALQGAVTATNLTLDADSTWTVTGASKISNLVIAEGANITAPAGKKLFMTVNGEETAIAAGSYSGEIELYTKDAVTVSLSADKNEVLLADGTASYTLSFANAKSMTIAVIEFEYAGATSGKYAEILEDSFEVFKSLVWTKIDGSTGTGKIVIMNSEGFTSAELTDILNIVLNVDNVGEVKLTIKSILITYFDESTGTSAYAEIITDSLSATVKVVEFYSKYNINGKDGVDWLDLSDFLHLYYLKNVNSEDWAEVQMYDYNGDGTINILDMYILYNNFT